MVKTNRFCVPNLKIYLLHELKVMFEFRNIQPRREYLQSYPSIAILEFVLKVATLNNDLQIFLSNAFMATLILLAVLILK